LHCLRVAIQACWAFNRNPGNRQARCSLIAGDAHDQAIQRPSPRRGFIFGLPLLMNYAVMLSFMPSTKLVSQFKGARLSTRSGNIPRVYTYRDTAVVYRPQRITLYSSCGWIFRAEPMVDLHTGRQDRYYSVMLYLIATHTTTANSERRATAARPEKLHDRRSRLEGARSLQA